MEKLDFDRLADGRFETYALIPTLFSATSPRQGSTPDVCTTFATPRYPGGKLW